jgi:hypothetical protein
MVVPASEQTKETMCIALFNRELHARSICPGNHDVCYGRGWFYFDSKPRHRPDLTVQAEELLRQGETVYYSPLWNTYVLVG